MKPSDIRPLHVKTIFSDEMFRSQFKLSSGAISHITYAAVEVLLEDRKGRSAKGVGGILLSDLWAFPTEILSHAEKDQIMRELVENMAKELMQLDDYYD